MLEKLPNSCCCTNLILPLAFDESLSYLEKICVMKGKINELISLFNTELEPALKEYIDLRFNDIIMDTIYESETETLKFFLKEK